MATADALTAHARPWGRCVVAAASIALKAPLAAATDAAALASHAAMVFVWLRPVDAQPATASAWMALVYQAAPIAAKVTLASPGHHVAAMAMVVAQPAQHVAGAQASAAVLARLVHMALVAAQHHHLLHRQAPVQVAMPSALMALVPQLVRVAAAVVSGVQQAANVAKTAVVHHPTQCVAMMDTTATAQPAQHAVERKTAVQPGTFARRALAAQTLALARSPPQTLAAAPSAAISML